MATLSEAKEAGLFHPNCGHSVTPYHESFSVMPGYQETFEKSGEEREADEELYDKKQKLNQINRNIRKWQDRKISVAGSADVNQKRQIDKKIKQWRKASKDYAKQNNLKNYNLPKTVTWSD